MVRPSLLHFFQIKCQLFTVGLLRLHFAVVERLNYCRICFLHERLVLKNFTSGDCLSFVSEYKSGKLRNLVIFFDSNRLCSLDPYAAVRLRLNERRAHFRLPFFGLWIFLVKRNYFCYGAIHQNSVQMKHTRVALRENLFVCKQFEQLYVGLK